MDIVGVRVQDSEKPNHGRFQPQRDRSEDSGNIEFTKVKDRRAAASIDFGGVANQTVFDDVTFGSSVVGTPGPSSLLLLGSGVLGLAGMIRRKLML